jgi:hypothetical protein
VILQRFLQGIGDQFGADVEVPHEPAQRQLIDQRHDGIGDRRQRQNEGKNEAQGK